MSILDHFSALTDRQRWRVAYPLPEILLVVLCATLSASIISSRSSCGASSGSTSCAGFLPYERGIPAHDTLNDVVNALEPDFFKTCFISWVETLRDGDTRSSLSTARPRGAATHRRARAASRCTWSRPAATRQRLVLGQEATAAKSNEITAIPLLLERLELTGALVTIDAMGTQTAIADVIVAKGGDYLLALKPNWPATFAEIERLFADPPPNMLQTPVETIDNDHGRLESRHHTVCHSVDWLFSDRRYPGEPRFPKLAMIGMVQTRVERAGKIEQERRYYLSSAKLDAKTFATPCALIGV